MDDEGLQEFVLEGNELLDALDGSFLALEADPTNAEEIGAVFRTVHTIKGDCGFLGFVVLEDLAHKAENLLSLLRDGTFVLDTETTDALLATVDMIRELMAVIGATGKDEGVDTSDLTRTLEQLAASRSTPEIEEPPDPQPKRIGDVLVERAGVSRIDVEVAAAEQQLGDDRPIGEILVDHGAATAEAIHHALEGQRLAGDSGDSAIRVDVGVLDDLMNLVGELVLARNEILQFGETHPDPEFGRSSQRLDLITSNLQEKVMRTRMRPIERAWSKLPRVVRDLSRQCGKELRIELEGSDTELDKSILEAIKDPITHIVRNTIDHGIEHPADREAMGKKREGILRLRARHEGGQVVIKIEDDGGGINLGGVRAKAVERGLVTPEVAESMSDREAVELIFRPGFSTVERVTNISGRGVGMDVVRNNLEAIGGSVEVQTELGVGTTFRLKIPLTLAIVPALTVRVAGRRFAIPQADVEELVTLGDGRMVEFINGTPVLRVRGRLLPIIDLRSVLDPSRDECWTGDVALVTAEGRTFGMVVDEVLESQEVVVKPLGPVLDDPELFSGATILGDGDVVLIIDLVGVARDTGVIGEGAQSVDDVSPSDDATAERVLVELSTVLVATVGDRQLAVLLEDVARLEEFHRSRIEPSGDGHVIQYRGQVMPLIDLQAEVGYGPSRGDDFINVVVYNHQGTDLGLIVEEVLDVAQIPVAELNTEPVILGRVTEIVDPGSLPALNRVRALAVSRAEMS